MINVTAVLSASLVCLAGVMSPGPNFVAVTHRAISSSRDEALGLVLGIALINVVWASTAVFGLNLLVATVPVLFWVLKFLGAAYLIWFGIQLLRRAKQPMKQNSLTRSGSTFQSAIRDGLVTNLANPKAMAFYASIFSGAVPADASTATLIVMIAMVGTIAVLWYGLVALALSTQRMADFYRHGKVVIERSCGLFLIFLGGRQGWF